MTTPDLAPLFASARSAGTAIQNPSAEPFVITPHDSNDEELPFRGVYVGVTGDVEIVLLDEDADPVLFKNAQAGSILPIIGKRVNATLTSATNLVGLR